MATLAEIRAKLASMDSNQWFKRNRWRQCYHPFWNIEGTSATLRFFDGDPITHSLGLNDK